MLRGLEALGAPVVVIDLEQVTFVGALVLGFLVKAQERADLGGWALVIVAPRDPARRPAGLTGLDPGDEHPRRPALVGVSAPVGGPVGARPAGRAAP